MPTLAEEMRAIATTTGKAKKEERERKEIEKCITSVLRDVERKAHDGENEMYLDLDGGNALHKQVKQRLEAHGFTIIGTAATNIFTVTW